MKTKDMSNPTRICSNCDNIPTCAMNSIELAVYHCEEHYTTTVKNHEIIKSLGKEINQEYTGLCSSCDFQKSCFLREENQIIFNCEHYQ